MHTVAIPALAVGLLAASGGSKSLIWELLDQLNIYLPLVFANLVAFLLTFAILSQVLFKRVRRHMDAREHDLAQERAGIAAAEKGREEAAQKLAEARAKLKNEAYERTQGEVRKGLERRNAALAQATGEALEHLNAVRKQCADEGKGVLKLNEAGLRDLVGDLVAAATGGVLTSARVGTEAEAAVRQGIAERSRA